MQRNSLLHSVYVYIFILFVLAAVATGYYFSRSAPLTTLTLGDAEFKAWVADTAQLREVGLGGKKHLAENQAMLFVFDNDDIYSFWMKDMHVAIDILWLDADKRVVHIEHAVSPDTHPHAFT